jgi:hypothetical protein
VTCRRVHPAGGAWTITPDNQANGHQRVAVSRCAQAASAFAHDWPQVSGSAPQSDMSQKSDDFVAKFRIIQNQPDVA